MKSHREKKNRTNKRRERKSQFVRSSPAKRAPAKERLSAERNPSLSPDGTICAIATPIGQGGIGAIRLSGDRAIDVASRVFAAKGKRAVREFASHTLHLGNITDPSTKEVLDEAMLAVLRAPRSYTREDTVEVYCHGGALVLHRILDLFLREGARLADPGEFTKRAFLNGRMDLTQAEAVMDLIRAKTEAGHRAAMAQLGGALHRSILDLRIEAIRLLAEIEAGIDFTEEGIEFIAKDQIRGVLDGLIRRIEALIETAASGKALREGIATAIVGPPNVGKSSLLNALLMQNRAIVTPTPGTTRDTVEEYLNIDGIPFRIMDTAGLREAADEVEREGVLRSYQAIEQADLVLMVLDATHRIGAEEEQLIRRLEQKPHLLILNKIDQIRPQPGITSGTPPGREGAINTSALTGEGLELLRKAVTGMIRGGIVTCGEREAMVNSRQKDLLLKVKQSILEAMKSSETGAPAELIAMDLRRGIDTLGEMTGETTTEDLLDRIFSDFCIGK